MRPIDEDAPINRELDEANRDVNIQPGDPLEPPLTENEIELNRDLELEEREHVGLVPGPEDVIEDDEAVGDRNLG
jgi:hypothetical protein